MSGADPLMTPDGRYIVVRGRLWRRTKPGLTEAERLKLTRELMDARRMISRVKRTSRGDLTAARAAVDRAKIALGERGPVWWDDGAPDYTRRLARNTPYADWYDGVDQQACSERGSRPSERSHRVVAFEVVNKEEP